MFQFSARSDRNNPEYTAPEIQHLAVGCRVLKGNNGTEDQLFGIRYGEPDNCLYIGGYTLKALEKGINARFSRQEIELNHIPESITLLEE